MELASAEAAVTIFTVPADTMKWKVRIIKHRAQGASRHEFENFSDMMNFVHTILS